MHCACCAVCDMLPNLHSPITRLMGLGSCSSCMACGPYTRSVNGPVSPARLHKEQQHVMWQNLLRSVTTADKRCRHSQRSRGISQLTAYTVVSRQVCPVRYTSCACCSPGVGHQHVALPCLCPEPQHNLSAGAQPSVRQHGTMRRPYSALPAA
jgi:hypothetical protein